MSFDMSMLSAYVDGELTPAEIAEVEALLAESAEARESVERLRAMNGLLVAAYDEPLRAALPPALRASLGHGARPRRLRRWWPAAGGMALAASIALAIGLIFGEYRSSDATLTAGQIARSSPFHELFETQTDGTQTDLSEVSATLVATFLDGQGRPCREVEISEVRLQSRTQAVACRSDGTWIVEVIVARPGSAPEERSDYTPASGGGGEVIAAALDALGVGPVLGPAELDELIDAGWNLP
jgi:hypothetical protein